jgi:hypothetical protein
MPINQIAKVLHLYRTKEEDAMNVMKAITLILVTGIGQDLYPGMW